MEFFHGTNIDFIGKRYLYFGLTLLLAFIGLFGFVKNRGPILGLEFTGGTLLQIGFQKLPPIDEIRGTLDKEGYKSFSLQTQPANQSIVVRIKGDQKPKDDVSYDFIKVLNKYYPNNVKPTADRVEYIGPVIGHTLVMNTYKAIIGSMLVICLYVAIRFKNWIWGAAGVIALMHDVFITWGIMTLMGKETTLVVVAALLTLAGYSINDTIVVFDRVRENLRLSRKEPYRELYNRSINETLGRTINTSLTAFIAALALYFLAGEVIHDFAFAMSFGIFIGTYSSIGVALSLVYQIEEHRRRIKKG